MLNRVCLVGRLVRDPDLRRTGNGKAVASFTLAVGRTYKREGEQEADFINCVCWSKVAENTSQYCSKGSLVSVEGRIQTRSYENNQGQKVYVTEVVADTVQFLDTRRNNGQAKQNETLSTRPQQSTIEEPRANEYVPNNGLDDIQF